MIDSKIKLSFMILAVVALVGLLAVFLPGIRLRVSRRPFPMTGRPGRYVYLANAQNTGIIPVKITGMQMPGGIVGKGTEYACDVLIEESKTHTWQRAVEITNWPKGQAKHSVWLFSMMSIQACGVVLPLDDMLEADCGKFVLHSSWPITDSNYLAQKEFSLIGTGGCNTNEK